MGANTLSNDGAGVAAAVGAVAEGLTVGKAAGVGLAAGAGAGACAPGRGWPGTVCAGSAADQASAAAPRKTNLRAEFAMEMQCPLKAPETLRIAFRMPGTSYLIEPLIFCNRSDCTMN